MLFITSTQGQQEICNYDPDVIFFENAQLEKLRKSILKGDCSLPSVVWKVELGNALQTYLRNGMDDLSDRDRETLKGLSGFQEESEERPSRVRFPDDIKTSPDIFFESESHRSPYRFIQPGSNDFHTFSKQNLLNRPFPRRFYAGSRLKRQIQQSDLNGPNPLLERQPKFFVPNNQKLHNNYFNPPLQNKENKNYLFQQRPQIGTNSFLPNNLPELNNRPRNPNKQQNLFIPNSKNVQSELVSEDLFKPIEQSNNQIRQDDNDQNSPKTQRQSNKQRNPVNRRRPPVLQRPQTTTPSPMRGTTLPGPPTWPTAPSLCVQRCPNTPEYNPVCGTDRVTYVNPGRLRCEQQCGKGIILRI